MRLHCPSVVVPQSRIFRAPTWETTMIAKFLTGLTATALVAAPIAASAAPAATPASKLSLSNAPRANAPTARTNRLAGESVLPILIGVGVVAAGVYLIIDKENEDDADSN